MHRAAPAGLILVGILLAQAHSAAAEKMSTAAVAPLYRTYIFGANPKLNPAVNFECEEWDIPGLWDALQLQIFRVNAIVGDSTSPTSPFIVAGGRISPFVNPYGGGLLSGVVQGDALYYSYGFGSGIHRSQVGRLRLRSGQPELHESKAYGMADMLVEKAPDGRVRVVVRDFRWPSEAPTPLGWIDATATERLRIIDSAGNEVALPMSAQPPTQEEVMRRQAKMAPFVKAQDPATRRMLEEMGILIDATNHAYIDPAKDDPTKIDVGKVRAAVDAWNLLSDEPKR